MRYNDLVPELGVMNFEGSLDFYTRVLPFRIEYERREKRFAFISLYGSQLMIEELGGTEAASEEEFRSGAWRTGRMEYPLGRGMSLSIRVNDLQSILNSLERAGHPLKMAPREAWYRRDHVLVGERQVLVLDPDGYLLRFQESLGERPAT